MPIPFLPWIPDIFFKQIITSTKMLNGIQSSIHMKKNSDQRKYIHLWKNGPVNHGAFLQ